MPYTLTPHPDGIDRLTLTAPDGAQATIAQLGAHVIDWRTPDGRAHLFTSATAEYKVGGAIRGGVPLIFPQFAALGTGTKHGFARSRLWTFSGVDDHDDRTTAHFTLTDSDETRAVWPHRFEAQVAVTVGGRALDISLSILNTDEHPFTFTAALHTYLRVDDIHNVVIDGLTGLRYRDSVLGGVEVLQAKPNLRVKGEMDRIYFDVPESIAVRENNLRRFTVHADGFPDAVIWNPGSVKGAALTDLEPDGYLRMLCVEAAAIGRPVTLAPRSRFEGRQWIEV